MTFLSRQEIINKGLMFLMCTFFLFPSLVFAGNPDADSDNIGHDVARIKTIVNRPHEKEVNIIHQINESLIATYSKYDKTIKIWNSVSFLLVAEYNVPGDDILEIFSFDKILFAKSDSTFFRIDLSMDDLKILFDTGRRASNSVINSKYIMFVMQEQRSQGTFIRYNHITDKIEFTKKINGMCGVCYVKELYYSNNKYYLGSSSGYYEEYDSNFNFIRSVPRDDIDIKSNANFFISKFGNNKDLEIDGSSRKSISDHIVTIHDSPNLESKIQIKLRKRWKHYSLYETFHPYLPSKSQGDVRIFLKNNLTKKQKLIYEGVKQWGSGGHTDVSIEFIYEGIVCIRAIDTFKTVPAIFQIIDFSGNKIGKIETDRKSFLIPINDYLFFLKSSGDIECFDFNLENKLSFQGSAEIIDIDVLGNLLITKSADFTTKTWDLNTGKLLATKYVFDENTEVTVTPEGYFSGKGNYEDYMHFVDNKLNVIQFDQFYNSLYRPDLVQAKLAGDPEGLVAEAASKLNLTILLAQGAAPKVSFLSPQPGISKIRDITIEAALLDQGGGIGKIVWKLNGQTIGVVEDDRGIKVVPTTSNKSITILKHITLSPEQNLIELIVYNKAGGMASDPATLFLNLKDAVSEPPALHILTVGINKYRDKSLWLNYAVPDATEIVKQLQLTGIGVFKKIDKIELYDQDATMPAIAQAFAQIAKKDKTNDVFILYLAGHGITLDGRYHFLPVDFRYRNEDSVRQKAINQDHLQKWLASLDSRKSLVLLDTCNSGSFTEAQVVRRGIAEKTAIDKLTRATGRATIAASTDSQVAYEGYKGHGVFTYALLQALSQADQKYGNKDNVTTTSELASFIDELVPEITYKKWGYEQVPQVNLHGRTFPIGVVR